MISLEKLKVVDGSDVKSEDWMRLLHNRRKPHPIAVKKALPQPKEEKAKPARKPIAAGSKKAGPGGKARYGYPTEKGKPGGQKRNAQEEAPQKPPEQIANGKPQPQPEPPQHEYADPAKLAALLHVSVGVLRKIATKFQGDPQKKGRTGFVNFMSSQLKRLNDKHDLGPKFYGLVYDALVGAPASPVAKADQTR